MHQLERLSKDLLLIPHSEQTEAEIYFDPSVSLDLAGGTRPKGKFLIDEDYTDWLAKEDLSLIAHRPLIEYQYKAINAMRSLELNPENEGLRSNMHHLYIPVGCGKSFVFLLLSHLFQDVPKHDIILSSSGEAIPYSAEFLRLEHMQKFYEIPGYDVADVPSAVCEARDYEQRQITVILASDLIVSQLEEEYKIMLDISDLKDPKSKLTSIVSLKDVDSFDYTGILLLQASRHNIQILQHAAKTKPFMRIIIDDFTGLHTILNGTQILASTTWLISGTGFARHPDNIPYGYYTTKTAPKCGISLIGDNSKMIRQIYQHNVFCMEVDCYKTNMTNFEFYLYVKEVIATTLLEKLEPQDIYNGPIIELLFILRNIHTLAPKFKILQAMIDKDPDAIRKMPYLAKFMARFPKQETTLSKALFYNSSSIRYSGESLVRSHCGFGTCEQSNPMASHRMGWVTKCCHTFYCSQHSLNHVNRNGKCRVCNNELSYLPNYIGKEKEHEKLRFQLRSLGHDVDSYEGMELVCKMIIEGITPAEGFLGVPGDGDQMLDKDDALIAIMQRVKPFTESDVANPVLFLYAVPQYLHKIVTRIAADLYPKVQLQFKSNMALVIGLHTNAIGIISYEAPCAADEVSQLIGRIIRINNKTPYSFYITLR